MAIENWDEKQISSSSLQVLMLCDIKTKKSKSATSAEQLGKIVKSSVKLVYHKYLAKA